MYVIKVIKNHFSHQSLNISCIFSSFKSETVEHYFSDVRTKQSFVIKNVKGCLLQNLELELSTCSSHSLTLNLPILVLRLVHG